MSSLPARKQRSLGAVGLISACLALAAVHCTSDHDALARRPGTAGFGGMGAASGRGGTNSAGGGSSGASGSNSGSGGTGGMKPIEAPGRAVTTLVHGVVDAERIAWCFARGEAGQDFFGTPLPRRGLGYGQSYSFETLSGVDLAKDDVSLYVLAGELELIEDLDCDDAVARARAEMAAVDTPPGAGGGAGAAGEGGAAGADGGEAGGGAGGAGGSGWESVSGSGWGVSGSGWGVSGSAWGVSGSGWESVSDSGWESVSGGEGGSSGEAGAAGATSAAGAGGSDEPVLPPAARLRVASVAALPKGTLREDEGYSLLLVAAGCIGGSHFADPNQLQVCGNDYEPRRGNLAAELVVLSRKRAPGAIALQALHASRAASERTLYVRPPAGDTLPSVALTEGITEGTLRPREARIELDAGDLGLDSAGWTVAAYANGEPLHEEKWPSILDRGGLEALEAGRGYTLILLGPASGSLPRWWNSPAFTVVDNDPGSEAP